MGTVFTVAITWLHFLGVFVFLDHLCIATRGFFLNKCILDHLLTEYLQGS
jgi:hypothetical protein